jgi:hypothetical protein
MPLMGIRKYARHRGVSHVAVIKAVRAGRIRRKADGRIDSAPADLAWERNTHPVSRVATGAEAGGGFTTARTVREHYRARLPQLTYEERRRPLVDAAEVQAAAREVNAACRQHLLGIPDRVVTAALSCIGICGRP